MPQLISVTGIGNFWYCREKGRGCARRGGYISLYLHIGSAASVACVFLLMYVNGKQLGELKHGVGSLGKSASRPFRPDAIC